MNSTHQIEEKNRRAGQKLALPIYIGEGTWIGANVIILPGVSIGKGCVIGAGSVVVSDVEDNSIYAGVPAKKLRQLE